ncbi:hypothetical protein [Ulvibacterium sp.]|uniref:hypothetical protein n=1 Tax=Ulvibacterium sp. TaxID=2665914 RepID=UPI003BAA87EF
MQKITLLLLMSLPISYPQNTIPKSIEEEAIIALSHYPDLKDVPIIFKFKKNIRKSTMQAQPVFGSLFKSREKRKYLILISEKFKIADSVYYTKDMPSDILIGWLGHELGHIMDYRDRSSIDLIGFGLGYLFSKNFIKKAERIADTYAVAHGMEEYILKTKNFILKKSNISEKYKRRIKELYLSPEEIMILAKKREADMETDLP